MLPGGVSWLDDIDAERLVIYAMGAGRKPPDWLDASHFTYPYHKFLFGYLKRCAIKEGEELNADLLVGLCLAAREGAKTLEHFKSTEDRRKALGAVRCADIDKIEEVGSRVPQMPFSFACKRVRDFAVKRRLHHRVQRLLVMLEQASFDPRELWREQYGIGELLTELTGTDGKVDGW